jgi:hypothetical protein
MQKPTVDMGNQRTNCIRPICWNIIAEWERWVDAEGEKDNAQNVRGLEDGTSDVNGAPRATGSG